MRRSEARRVSDAKGSGSPRGWRARRRYRSAAPSVPMSSGPALVCPARVGSQTWRESGRAPGFDARPPDAASSCRVGRNQEPLGVFLGRRPPAPILSGKSFQVQRAGAELRPGIVPLRRQGAMPARPVISDDLGELLRPRAEPTSGSRVATVRRVPTIFTVSPPLAAAMRRVLSRRGRTPKAKATARRKSVTPDRRIP